MATETAASRMIAINTARTSFGSRLIGFMILRIGSGEWGIGSGGRNFLVPTPYSPFPIPLFCLREIGADSVAGFQSFDDHDLGPIRFAQFDPLFAPSLIGLHFDHRALGRRANGLERRGQTILDRGGFDLRLHAHR